jgi:hypothetical protein
MDIINNTNNHGSNYKFQEPMHLLMGLRHPRSIQYASDGVFVVAQKTADSPIHTCVFVDGVRFTSIMEPGALVDRIEFLKSIYWDFLNETDIRLVCWGMSHIYESDIFWSSEYKGF